MSTSLQPEDFFTSLDGIRRAEPRPFFTGRLLARLKAENEPAAQTFVYRWRWALTFILIILLFGANILLIMRSPGAQSGLRSDYERTTPLWVEKYTSQPSASIYASPNP